jgi:hypothetical protein
MEYLPDPPSEHDVSTALRQYEFKTKSMRVDGGQPKYRYQLHADKLAEIVERYGHQEG